MGRLTVKEMETAMESVASRPSRSQAALPKKKGAKNSPMGPELETARRYSMDRRKTYSSP